MFLKDGAATDETPARLLMSCAMALGADDVRLDSFADWLIVGSKVDWWSSASHPISEDLNRPKVTAVPEWGQNSVRQEMLIALLHEDVVIKRNQHLTLAKGTHAAFEAVRPALEHATGWRRAVAFRGTAMSDRADR